MKKARGSLNERRESGLDKFLRKSMKRDLKLCDLFLAEVKKLPRDSQTRVLRNFPMTDPVAKYHALAEAPRKL